VELTYIELYGLNGLAGVLHEDGVVDVEVKDESPIPLRLGCSALLGLHLNFEIII
jgi:hypothetical protein